MDGELNCVTGVTHFINSLVVPVAGDAAILHALDYLGAVRAADLLLPLHTAPSVAIATFALG